jgi:hypothetical protein
LKIDRYKKEDWQWLIAKYEYRISHWCNRWLSIGGRLILIKVVLEIQPVYWLALANLPSLILHRIQQLVFSFLWSGRNKKKKFHMCDWKLIARPKHHGGWGLRNLGSFGRAMTTNTLWRALMQDGLWHRVLKDKYFPFVLVARWLRTITIVDVKGSRTWKHLLKSLHILLHWLAWSLGTWDSILLGKDRILGLGYGSIMSEELITTLNRKGIFYLYQAHCEPRVGMIGSNWRSSDDMELEGCLAYEWKIFCRALINTGVQLVEKPDVLIWTRGDASGHISVKNVYVATKKKKWNFVIGGWRKAMWSWVCPLKIKLFTWLIVENKILTWEILQRRGFIGPSYCHLCKKSKETTYHLFVECSFTLAVWNKIKSSINILGRWTGNTLSKCFKLWKEQNLSYPCLSVVICWFIWKERNLAIFEDGTPSLQKVAFQSLSAMRDCNSKTKVVFHRHLPPPLVAGGIVGWFDGVAHSSGLNCGAGGIIRINEHRCYKWIFNCGPRTNTKAELLGAWALLTLASRLSILGDPCSGRFKNYH